MQKKYLAQLHNISPDYSRGVYELLLDPEFTLDEVAELSETAHLWYREKKFLPLNGERLSGMVPPAGMGYN